MTERRRFTSLQAGRGIAAIMVVFAHIGGFVGKEPGLWQRTAIYDWFSVGGYGVDFFFVLSGVVILSAHWSDIGRPAQIGSFLWKRFRRIYPMYWIFLVPTLLKQLSVDTGYAARQRDPFVILSSVLLVHIRSLGFNLLPSWTLFHEVLFYLCFVTLLMNRRWGILVCSCWFGTSFFFFTQAAFAIEPACYLEMLFSPMHLLFAFGLLVGWILQQQRGPTQLWVFLFGLTVFVGGLILEGSHRVDSPWIRILAGAGMALALLTAAEREHLQKFHVPAFLCFLGDASYSIYLSHFMVLSLIARKGFELDQRLHLPLAVWIVTMLVAAVFFGVITHIWIERPLLRRLGRGDRVKMNVGT
jgi:exopolysaccharide production protein ExoZ